MFRVEPLQPHTDVPRFLVTMPPGVGDVVSVGLSAVDQIMKNDSDACGKIDLLCNAQQAGILRYDPRINRLIIADAELFPAAGSGTFLRGVFLSDEVTPLLHFLRERSYEALFPGLPAPAFYSRLHLPLMHPHLAELGRDLLALRMDTERHISTMVRKVINAYFGDVLPPPQQEEEIRLYIHPDYIRHARALATQLREQSTRCEDRRVLLIVAPDTSSEVTRPPVELLAAGLAGALEQERRLVLCLLPAYTEVQAPVQLYDTLSPRFPGRVEMIARTLVPTLLDTTALIDQADIFLTGDTGVMHLAVATKVLTAPADVEPENAVRIIALFGGTHPGFYGYAARTTILGRDRKEQKTLSPGIAKELYIPTGVNFFDHISPRQVTEAILQASCSCAGAWRKNAEGRGREDAQFER